MFQVQCEHNKYFNNITQPFKKTPFINLLDTTVSKLYLEEKQLCLKYNKSHIKLDIFNYERRSVSLLNGQNNGKVDDYSRMNELCRVGLNSTGCVRANCHAAACRHYVCPGMFKCHHNYCIYMSHVCDGYYDCKEADDEMFCPVTSCPGLLKCRGESRCVSREEICDNTVNCLHSMDDEIDCHICPVSCECNGYSVECHVDNSLALILSSGINYIKCLLLTGVQQQLYVHNLHIRGLLYINASFCKIKQILNSGHEDIKSFILFADFKYNELVAVKFLEAAIFKNMLYLDLSFNKLTSIKYISSFFMTRLLVLSIAGNPLNAIIFNSYHVPMLNLLDMRSLDNYIDLDIYISHDLRNQLQVKVSDSLMCCMLRKNIKCTSDTRTEICTGLMSNHATRAVFYFLSAITLFVSIFAIKKHSLQMSLFRQNSNAFKNNKKKYYYILLLNYDIAAILISLYLCGLLFADVFQVNVIFWTVGQLCVLLKLILYNSLMVFIIFKTASVVFLSLQIIYPFKHQCSSLKWTGQISTITWIKLIMSCPLTFLEQTLSDRICSIGKCSDKDMLLLFVDCCTFKLFILFSILALLKTYGALKKKEANVLSMQAKVTQSTDAIHVSIKIMTTIILELPLQLCLFSLLALKLANGEFAVYCQSIFLFVLPITVSSSLTFILLK